MTRHCAVTSSLSAAIAEIVAVPAATALITPSSETMATDSSDDFQLIPGLVIFSGAAMALSVAVFPGQNASAS